MAEDNPRIKKMEELLVHAFAAEALGKTSEQKRTEQELYELAFQACSEMPGKIAEIEKELKTEQDPTVRALLELKQQMYQRLYQQYTDFLNDFIE